MDSLVVLEPVQRLSGYLAWFLVIIVDLVLKLYRIYILKMATCLLNAMPHIVLKR